MRPKLTLSYAAIPKRGGQGLNMYHMVEALRADFDLTIFSLAPMENVKSHAVLQSKISNALGTCPYLRRLRDWQTYWSSRHFDLVVTNRLEPGCFFQGLTGFCERSIQKATRLGSRTVLDVVTAHIDTFVEQQKTECTKFGIRPSMNAVSQARTRREYENADLIRVMSNYAKETFVERGFAEERIVVARPPIDVAEFPIATFAEPKFRIGFAGLLEPWKGFHYLIDAFNTLARKETELFLFGGTGSRPVSQYVQTQIHNNPRINLCPVEIRKAGYGNVYGRCNVLVHPSLTDGFGYVVTEAMATGIPVIVTRSTGAADLVQDGVNGYVIPPRDVAALVDRIAYLLDNPAVAREMGAAARRTAEELTMENFRKVYVSRLKAA